jgi:hypothetical protein
MDEKVLKHIKENSMEEYRALTDLYNVTYTVPGKSDRSAMPLGNGRVGISLWVEQDGDLQFYIGHTDAQSEMDRNLKLGKVILTLEPNPFAAGCTFKQELRLREGSIHITAGQDGDRVQIVALVDAESDSIFLEVTSQQSLRAGARLLSWRTAEKAPWDIPDFQRGGVIKESADLVERRENGILFYHKNGRTLLESTAQIEGLADHRDLIVDTLENRTFGGYMTLLGGKFRGQEWGMSASARKRQELRVSVFCAQNADTPTWLAGVIAAHKNLVNIAEAARRTAARWDRFFGSSYVFVDGDPARTARVSADVPPVCLEPDERLPVPSQITQAYILTRFMFACAGLGKMPLAFNGLIFNLMPGLNRHLAFEHFCQTFAAQPVGQPNLEINPDEKGWEECCTLWQNVRLPYESMLARGETEPLRGLFAYYRKFWEINRAKAAVYYQVEGQYNTEITHSFGLMPARIYGIERSGLKDGYAVNRWGGAIDISPGLELCYLMLDYYHFTHDLVFLQQDLLPYAEDLLHYVEARFFEREEGKIVLTRLQSVETYFDTTNPIPVVAGMQAVLDGILALDVNLVPNRRFFEELRSLTPDLPLERDEAGSLVLAPARAYEPKRNNVENPPLYAVFPFRLFGLGKPDFQRMKDTFWHCMRVSGGYKTHQLGVAPGAPGYSGWQYTGMAAARLGMAEEAAEILANNCALKNPGTRFPAMWGPVYDAIPDVDHGANIMTTLQLMLFQMEGNEIRILPAWPKDWNVRFKLYVSQGVSIECDYRGGKVEKLVLDPADRLENYKFL